MVEYQENIAVPAGFWLRFGAYCIDFFILAMLSFVLMFNLEYFSSTYFEFPISLNLIINWLYYAFMESSSHQATLGKMAMHIQVTDMQLHKISFATASLRWLCKLFSVATFGIGYLMIAFTKRKQGLHDIMANCLVVRIGYLSL